MQITEFTLLTFLYCVLLWAGLAGKIPRHWHVLSFLLQASCVFAISLVVRQDNVVLSLYLVLTLEAIDILQDTRLALLVASSTLVLFVFNELLSRGVLKSWTTALVASWVSTDYAALTLFLVGYLLLYLQLSRAHTQLATAHIAVVILTTFNEDDLMLRGLRAGACGYLLKDVNRETLLRSIRSAARGETLLQPEVFTRLLSLTQPSLAPELATESVKKADKIDLTERERSILAAVARGERSKEIAAHLSITAATVAAHLTNIYAKLGADSRASAVAIAIQRGLLSLNEEEGS